MLKIVSSYSNNQSNSRSSITKTRANNQNHSYAVKLTSSQFQHSKQKQKAQLNNQLQYAQFSNNVSKHKNSTNHYHSSKIIALLKAKYQQLPKRSVVIKPQAQVIYQSVQQNNFTAANRARVSQSQSNNIQTQLSLHSKQRTAVHVIPTLNLNYYHNPHSTKIKKNSSTISNNAVKQQSKIKVKVTSNISQQVSLRSSVAQQKKSNNFAQTAKFLSITVKQ